MSTIQDKPGIWSMKETDSRYEKCRNITEEIYKRINITFQIKQLETAAQSDVSEQSDQIDSNELSNETDLFACDKTSISSSTEAERAKVEPGKFINNNNNEEKLKKPVVVCKRPRKRFRKKIKKRQSKHHSESDASSDEALPLSRMIDMDAKGRESPPLPVMKIVSVERKGKGERGESPDRVMGVPLVPVVRLVKVPAKDLKPKIESVAKATKKDQGDQKVGARDPKEIKEEKVAQDKDKAGLELKGCSLCSLSFRGERGLRRHMTMSHNIASPTKERSTRPA